MTAPVSGDGEVDPKLLRALFDGQANAWESFARRVQSDVYTACRLAFSNADQVDNAFIDILQRLRENNFAVLRTFDSKYRATFASFFRLKLADLLADRVIGLFVENVEQGWKLFEYFFRRDITIAIRSASHDDNIEDYYQDVCLALTEDNYRRIRSYSGTGSFVGFLRSTVKNLCTDLVRKQEGRRRLPAAVTRLPALEQEIYRQIYWNNCPEDQLLGVLAQRGLSVASDTDLKKALDTVRRNVQAGRSGTESPRPIHVALEDCVDAEGEFVGVALISDLPGPEEQLVLHEAERSLEAAAEPLRNAVKSLPDEMRLYLLLRFWRIPPLPPRDIARLMKRSSDEVYRLGEQATRVLRGKLAGNESVKNFFRSV